MKKRTIKFVENILDTRLNHCRHNTPHDITDLVFREIENDTSLLNQYNTLLNDGTSKGYINSKMTINQFIGRHVKDYWKLKNRKLNTHPNNNLSKTYREHQIRINFMES